MQRIEGVGLHLSNRTKKVTVLESSHTIYIYGTGTFAKRIRAGLQQLGFSKFQFLEFDGVFQERTSESLNPSSIFPNTQENVVVLGLGNAYADIRTIATKLHALGVTCIYPVEISQYLFSRGINLSNYWLTGNENIIDENHEKIELVTTILSDEKSKNLLLNILHYRVLGDPFKLFEHDSPKDTYLPKDIDWIPKDEMLVEVIDGGAHIGDTLESFLSAGVQISSWNCFEPDEKTFRRLETLYNQNEFKFDVRCNKLALWSSETILKFTSSGDDNTGSHIAENGSQFIETIRIDDYLNGNKCSLIKLDIEGAELEALNGAVNTLQLHRPYLAISLYHKPEDIWEIPLFISSLGIRYEYFMRTHFEQSFETVLYCRPKNRI